MFFKSGSRAWPARDGCYTPRPFRSSSSIYSSVREARGDAPVASRPAVIATVRVVEVGIATRAGARVVQARLPHAGVSQREPRGGRQVEPRTGARRPHGRGGEARGHFIRDFIAASPDRGTDRHLH